MAALGAQAPMTLEEALEHSQRGDRLFADARFRDAISSFLEREHEAVAQYADSAAGHTPFHRS